jgi:hypothetical protein
VERALALREVMDHAVKVEREISKPMAMPRSRARLIGSALVCIPLIAFCAYSWIARTEFIWGPSMKSVASSRS